MVKTKTYQTRDDEHDIVATTAREHKPDGFRPHEILRVTMPMLAAVQKKQDSESMSVTSKDAWLWLCSRAGVECAPEWLNSAPLEQREKQRQKQEAAKADTSDLVAVAVLAAFKAGKTETDIAKAMQKQKYTMEQIKHYLPNYGKKAAPVVSFI